MFWWKREKEQTAPGLTQLLKPKHLMLYLQNAKVLPTVQQKSTFFLIWKNWLMVLQENVTSFCIWYAIHVELWRHEGWPIIGKKTRLFSLRKLANCAVILRITSSFWVLDFKNYPTIYKSKLLCLDTKTLLTNRKKWPKNSTNSWDEKSAKTCWISLKITRKEKEKLHILTRRGILRKPPKLGENESFQKNWSLFRKLVRSFWRLLDMFELRISHFYWIDHNL